MNIIELSRNLMLKQTEVNHAPAWLLTEIAINKGKELCRKYNVEERLVLASLYLAHTIFSPVWKGSIQQDHPKLSAEFVKPYLKNWNVNKEEQKIIINSILAHHGDIKTESKIAEVVKNAEGFKFLTVQGSLIFLHELGSRNIPYEKAVEMVIQKMNQKKKLLTLDDCINEANINTSKILNIFSQ